MISVIGKEAVSMTILGMTMELHFDFMQAWFVRGMDNELILKIWCTRLRGY